ncbi:MAG: hypothetical protein H7Z38_02920 [Rubrivivax sp.]|nr:hypothetical protein [Pyrinomonadaceae bacterium]
MESLTRTGRVLFAVSMAAMGILNFIYSDTVSGLEPVPSWVPGRLFWAYLTGAVLIAAGACIVAGKKPRLAAVSLGIMLLLWVLLLQAPKMAVRPYDGSAWTTTFETLALCGVAWVLAGSLTTGQSFRRRWDDVVVSLAAPGRICFGISMLVFGGLHFIYAGFVATLVPAWIPGRAFWPYFTGAAFVAAGLSIMTKVKARLAATLLGVMFGAWVLILHAPRVAAKPGNREEWTSLLVAAAMCGAAWLVAGSLAREDSAKRVDLSV